MMLWGSVVGKYDIGVWCENREGLRFAEQHELFIINTGKLRFLFENVAFYIQIQKNSIFLNFFLIIT